MEIKKFENSLIAFDFESDMINATDMLKAFPEKRMNDFLRLKSTKDYIYALELKTGFPVISTNTGKFGGTFMYKLLAYKFAGWLNSNFEIFVYSVFDEFMKSVINSQNEKLISQQRQLDYFWDREDINDLYKSKKS